MKNILVMDDNKHILEALSENLCMLLKDCGVHTAGNWIMGREILKSTDIDLILTDQDMFNEDGYRFIEDAKKDIPSIPVCVMTGQCAPHVKEKLRAMGVNRYIEKPFHVDALVNMIKEELQPHAG